MDKLPRRGKDSLEKLKNSTKKGRKYPSNLREQVDDEVMAFWRTPDAHCGRGTRKVETLKKRINAGAPLNLNDQVAHEMLWRTPIAAEAMRLKFDKKQIISSFYKGHVNITSQAYHALMKSAGKGSLSQESAHSDKGSGRLNPLWVEQLMGFPVGWTEVCSAEN